uniref:Uncharacterized protein n=1 Tax=Quercus lobata TaxID=97700 RepID=A0A7N2M7W1_QUELO
MKLVVSSKSGVHEDGSRTKSVKVNHKAQVTAHGPARALNTVNPRDAMSEQLMDEVVNLDAPEVTHTGNEPYQSNQPPHRAIWKPPPWLILKVNSEDAIFREQNSLDVVLDMGGGLVLFWRSTIDVIVEGSGTNYIDTMFQEEDRAGIGVIIRECQGKGLAHMVGIIPLPLTVIELETLAILKTLQFDADLSLEDVTPEGVSEIAMNALNANS